MVVFAFLFIGLFFFFILWMKPGELWEGWLWLIFTKHFIKVPWISTCFNISKRIKPINIRWVLATQMTCQLAMESCCFSVLFLPREKREAAEVQLAWLSVHSVLTALRLVRCIERQRSHFFLTFTFWKPGGWHDPWLALAKVSMLFAGSCSVACV